MHQEALKGIERYQKHDVSLTLAVFLRGCESTRVSKRVSPVDAVPQGELRAVGAQLGQLSIEAAAQHIDVLLRGGPAVDALHERQLPALPVPVAVQRWDGIVGLACRILRTAQRRKDSCQPLLS